MYSRQILRAFIALPFAVALGATPLLAQQDLGREGTSWKWDAPMVNGASFRLYNLNGPVHITASSDGSVHVRAEKQVRQGGDPTTVHYAVVRDGNNIAVCALWTEQSTCNINGMRNRNDEDMNNNDGRRRVQVSFDIQVPTGVRTAGNTVNGGVVIERINSDVTAHTVNGEVRVEQTGGEVRAGTVNGDVTVNTRGGPVSATTVNGGVHVTMGSQGTSDMRFSTVNGDVEITGPSQLNADVELSTVNGSIDSKYPLNFDRRRRHADGTVGSGGPRLRATTVNGSISLR